MKEDLNQKKLLNSEYEDELDLHEIFLTIMKHKKKVIMIILLGTILSGVVSYTRYKNTEETKKAIGTITLNMPENNWTDEDIIPNEVIVKVYSDNLLESKGIEFEKFSNGIKIEKKIPVIDVSLKLGEDKGLEVEVLNSLLTNSIEEFKNKYLERKEFKELEDNKKLEYGEYLNATILFLNEMEIFLTKNMTETVLSISDKNKHKQILEEIKILKEIELEEFKIKTSNWQLARNQKEKKEKASIYFEKMQERKIKLALKTKSFEKINNRVSEKLEEEYLKQLLEISEINYEVRRKEKELKKGRDASFEEQIIIENKIEEISKKLEKIIIETNMIALKNSKKAESSQIKLEKPVSILEVNHSKTKMMFFIGVILSIIIGGLGAFFAEFLDNHKKLKNKK